jgi:hypothetical protein
VSRLSDYLTDQLNRKVTRHGVVVWDDKDLRYNAQLVAGLVPTGAAFAAYDGSWYALRQKIEPLLSRAERPALVVYVPARKPNDKEDPLAEVRRAGTEWSPTLQHVLTEALGGELTPSRIRDLANQARSLAELEQAVDAGSAVDARLVSLFGTGDAVTMAVAVLAGTRDAAISTDNAWPLVAETLAANLGSALPSGIDELRAALFRQVALVSLGQALDGLPDALASAAAATTAAQATACTDVLHRLRDPRLTEVHRRLAEAFDTDLHITEKLTWQPALTTVDVSPAVESLALAEAVRRLADRDYVGAHGLADERLRHSCWLVTPTVSHDGEALGSDLLRRRWVALDRLALWRQMIDDRRPPQDSAGVLSWYAQAGWEVDRAHRLAELARADAGHMGAIDAEIAGARQAYEHWLDEVATTTSTAVMATGPGDEGLLRQAELFERFAAQTDGPVAYVLVDALRFELGHALARRLGAVAGSDQPVLVEAAVAAAPTITPVGMTNVLPRSANGLTLSVTGSKLVVALDGAAVKTVPDRVAVLRRHAGVVLDVDLTQLMDRTDARLGKEIAKADLVLVRSTEIDSAGESGHAGTAWRTVDGILDDLATQILRLGQLGVKRVVVTADHGFITLSQQISSGRTIERPSADGDLHRRCWIGKGGVTPDGTVRLTMAEVGHGGDLDLVVPRGLAVFPVSGSRQFFHGGLSPQELVVPVLVLDLAARAGHTDDPGVEVAVAGKGITTGVFAATLTCAGSLFTDKVLVRVVAKTAKGTTPVARVVAGDGYDVESGTVVLSVEPSVLTFQVTANLDPSTKVDLQVLDATTGLELKRVKVPVAHAVVIEEDWL